MKNKLIFVILILSQTVMAQIPTDFGFALSKAYNKDISIVKAKAFVTKDILNSSEDVGQFEFDLLAATSTGELSSFAYKCKEKNKEGLILGFYGDYWNESGDVYKGFAFKNFPKDKAVELLSKISGTIEGQREYLSKSIDNNVYFQYDDISIIIWKNLETKIRISWNGFDADWENLAFTRTKRRFENNLN